MNWRRLLFPRSAWEHKSSTLRVAARTYAERPERAFPRGAWERGERIEVTMITQTRRQKRHGQIGRPHWGGRHERSSRMSESFAPPFPWYAATMGHLNSLPAVQSPAGLSKFIREIPDFPKPGILFRDITPLLA